MPTAPTQDLKRARAHLLAVVDGVAQVFELAERGDITIGRSSDCDIRIEHASVSRRHCVIHRRGEMSLEDLGSVNGTRLAETPLRPATPTPLALGTVFEIGMVRAVVHVQAAVSKTALSVSHNGRWFEYREKRVDLGRRPHLRAILLTLAGNRLAAPGKRVSTEALVRAGWPGQRLIQHSAAIRLRVAVSMLRKLGLRDVLASRGGGYLLDADVPLELVRFESTR